MSLNYYCMGFFKLPSLLCDNDMKTGFQITPEHNLKDNFYLLNNDLERKKFSVHIVLNNNQVYTYLNMDSPRGDAFDHKFDHTSNHARKNTFTAEIIYDYTIAGVLGLERA